MFSDIHLLPFFDPIDGADAGFDPGDHTEVDARLGTSDDVQSLGAWVELAADLIVNRLSIRSPLCLDFFMLESFTAGRDAGIDFRYRAGTYTLIARVKHRADSGYDALVRVLKQRERRKLEALTSDR